MAKVAIVTDSTLCLPQDLIDNYDIEIVPMEFIYEGKAYRDGIDISPPEFYELLSKANKLPTTSAPSPGNYFKVLQKIVKKTSEILIITLSAKFSHAFDAARTAAELCKERLPNTVIEVLDCGTAAGAQGFVVLEAAKKAAQDMSLDQVLAAARQIMPRVHVIAFIDTLVYLAKGGRIPYIAAWASQLLDIKPLFELVPLSGGAIPVGRVRTRARAIKRLMDILRERTDRKPMHAIVLHTNAPAEAEKLKKRIITEFNCIEIYLRDFTPVMGVHTGPGLLGLAFYFDN